MPTLEAAQIRTHPGEPFRASAQTVDLGSAPLIVSVGRGIKEEANLPLVQDLATALGAELAASRPICDNGWLPMERQVGSSGQTVAPKLYLAVGISGAIQHLVGMKGSQCIVAINKDPDAPIFEVADYGIVGDLFEVVPALTAAVRKVKGIAPAAWRQRHQGLAPPAVSCLLALLPCRLQVVDEIRPELLEHGPDAALGRHQERAFKRAPHPALVRRQIDIRNASADQVPYQVRVVRLPLPRPIVLGSYVRRQRVKNAVHRRPLSQPEVPRVLMPKRR